MTDGGRIERLRGLMRGSPFSLAVACFGVVLVGLVWAFVLLEVWQDREATVERVMRENQNLVRAFEEHVVRTLKNSDQTLLVVRSLYQRQGARFDLSQYARDAMLETQPFNIVTILDANGDLIQASRPFAPVNHADRELFRFHANSKTDELHISKPLIGRTTGRASVFISRRITGPDGSFGGVVVLALDPQYFSDFYNQIKLGKGDVVILIGLDGVVRARQSDGSSATGQDASGSRLMRVELPARPVGSYIDTGYLDHITRLFSYRRLSDYPLVMLVGTAEATALAGFNKRRSLRLWGGAATTLIILLLTGLLTLHAWRQTRTAERLRHSEARFRAIFDHAALAIGERSFDGRWIGANRHLCKLLGYGREELLSMSVLDHTLPQDHAATLEQSAALKAGKAKAFAMDKRYVRKDGSTVWVHIATATIPGASGEPAYAICIIEDISARKSAEDDARNLRAQLEERVAQRTAELEAANRDLESFSYSVSHDLRTPLRAISGFAQILARRYRDGLNDEGRRYVDNIVRASAHMGRLIEDLLTYSRLGRKAVKLQTVALAEVLEAVLEPLQPGMREKGAQVAVRPGMPAVAADPTLLGQVLANLLDNALTYHRPGTPPAVEVSWRLEGEHVVVSVKDNGIGIAPEHFETIFGVFQRLHSDDYPGTGIGLATVKQAVKRMDGRVWLESTVGVGTVFHVQLRRPASAD